MNHKEAFLRQESVTKTVLDNGTRVLIDHIPGSSSVCICLALIGGSRSEQPNAFGVTHLLEHVLFRRTATKEPKVVARVIDSLGGDVNGYTDTDGMYLVAHVPKARGVEALEFLAELLFESRFSDGDIELEKEIIRQEIFDARDHPPTVVYEAFCELFWKDSQLAHPVYGTIESVSGFEKSLLQALLKSFLCGRRIIVAAAGDIGESLFTDKCAEIFSSLPSGEPLSWAPVNCSSGFTMKPQSVGQSYMTLGFAWEPLSSEKYYHGLVASYILGEMMTSRLFQKVREERGLAYDISSEIDAHIDTAAMLINFAVEPKNLKLSEALVLEQVDKVKNSIEDSELELAVQFLGAHLAMTSDNITARMWRCLENEFYFSRHIPLQEVMQKVEQIDLAVLQALLKERLADGRCCAVVGGETEGYQPGPELLRCCAATVT